MTTKQLIDLYDWVEWKNRKHGTVTAHAVDPDSEDKTGVLRALNGSLIPDIACKAESATPKDTMCVHIIVTKAARQELADAKADAKAKAPKKAPKAKATKVTKAAKAAKASKKAAKVAECPHGLGYVEADVDGSTGTKVLRVVIEGTMVKILENKLKSKGDVDLKVTGKSWGIYQGGKRVGFGRR